MMTQLNDFMFCPRSIFFSRIYHDSVNDDLFHQECQTQGLAAHAAVDENRYSSRKSVITGMMVYSEKYNLLGRIDIFDTETGVLTERKYSVKAVYPGFRYQLYAQYFALGEEGFDVRAMRLYSSKDNKNYPVPLPGENEIREFEDLVSSVRSFRMETPFEPEKSKCRRCIYAPLCDADPDDIG